MESKHRAKTKKARHHLAAGALALVALAATGTGILSTGALFTDSQSVDGNTFTTGTLDLTASPTSAAITMTNMAPGDVEYGEITMNNPGSLDLRYAATQAATNTDGKDLAASLNLQVKSDVATCDAAGFAGGTVVTASQPFNTATVFGSNGQGQQAGDRLLNADANEKLCFRVELPLSAANALQGATTTGTFTFHAEQTANN